MDFRAFIRDSVGHHHSGIEIGAAYAPILPKADGYRTLVVDQADQKTLRANYSGVAGVDLARIEPVDAIDDGGEFSLLDDEGMGFDFIVASHVIEHVTDPIHFLQRCERALKPDGRIYLLVPDRRACFDWFRPVSTAGQWLEAFLQSRRRHGPAALFDDTAYYALRDGAYAWDIAPGGVHAVSGTARAGYERAVRVVDDYDDAHAWVFTPSSARLIVEDLRSIGLIGLGESRFHPTIGCEFLLVLSRDSATRSQDRLALAREAVAEARFGTASAEQTNGYAGGLPTAQQAVDLFAGHWVAALPPAADATAGAIALHDDARIRWLVESLGGVTGMEVLELGPLEASHTAMLLAAGARSVLAIEANRNAYLRCLVVKEILGLRDARFALGDFRAYLDAETRRWPLIVASGVLYHTPDPLRLLELLAARTDTLFLWTHVIDDEAMPPGDPRRAGFEVTETRTWRGMTLSLSPWPYGAASSDPKFCGGPEAAPRWMARADLLRALELLGFDSIEIAHETPGHPSGPALCVLARRRGQAG